MLKIFSVILFVCLSLGTASSKIVGCYWGAWTSINKIDITLCTHAYFAFYIPDSNGGIKTDSGLVSSFLALKSRKPSVKLLASIGGWNAGTASFSAIASNPSARSNFVRNCVSLTAQGFDGIDIDWEFPGASEKQAYVNFLAELKSALKAKGKILAAAVNSGAWQTSQSYIIPSVCNNLDLVNLMTYDFQWPYTTTGTNAGYSQVNSAANLWVSGGCSSNKLVLGLASYGYDFNLINPSRNGVGASATGATSISYRDICKKLKSSGWTTLRTDQTPYSYKGTEWISYDDISSLKAKLNIVTSRNLAGAFFWSTDLDDYDNSCGLGSFPLISSLSKAFGGSSGGSVNPNPTTSKPTNPLKVTCSTDGFFPYPGDCTKFYRCISGTAFTFTCPSGLGYNPAISACDYKSNISGCS